MLSGDRRSAVRKLSRAPARSPVVSWKTPRWLWVDHQPGWISTARRYARAASSLRPSRFEGRREPELRLDRMGLGRERLPERRGGLFRPAEQEVDAAAGLPHGSEGGLERGGAAARLDRALGPGSLARDRALGEVGAGQRGLHRPRVPELLEDP